MTDNKRQLIKVICDELIQDEQFCKHKTTNKLIVTGEDIHVPSEDHKGIIVNKSGHENNI